MKETVKIMIHHRSSREKWLEELGESLIHRELCFLASTLGSYGLSAMELETAVERAMRACKAAQLPVREHFKAIYTDSSGWLHCDWRLSSLGQKLVILNASPDNPLVARLQMKLVA